MRDMKKRNFDSNSPMRNYVKLSERIEELECKMRRMEQEMLNLGVESNLGNHSR